ncbi:MAG: hypothetical protein WC998_00270 [Candidatus Paceibacterota bacterium]|jgi:hypothetical protein
MKITNFYKILLIVAVAFIIFPAANTYAADNVAVIANPGSCDLLLHPLECVSSGIINTIINIAGILAPAALRIGEYFLNAAISGDVLGAGFTPDSNEYIATGWGIVRNLANAALVIGLVVIAVGIILGYQENQAKKILLNFIIIALLINFTPVICGFIIDGANILTKSMMTGGIDDSYSKSISNLFVIIGNMKGGWIDQLALTIVVTFFSLFATVIYLLYALLFFGRIVILWILVIVSPIAFATKVFPQSKYIRNFFPSVTYWDDWWESFIQWCVIGIPAGMSIYLSNTMIAKIASTSNSTAATEANIFGILIGYSIPFIFLLAGFFISISSGGKVGTFVGGVATGAWAVSGGRAANWGREKIKAGGEWVEGRTAATGSYIKEGAAGIAGVIAMDKTDQPRPLSVFNKEDREAGRQAISGWKKRVVQDTPLKYLTNPPALEKDKEAAMENYNKNWNRYNQNDRDKIEKMLIDKDTSLFLKGGIDKDKTPEENSREYQRRLASVGLHGGEKTKFEAYLHASGNTQFAGMGGIQAVNEWATKNKIDAPKKLRSMSAKDAREKIGADAIRQNPEILRNMGEKAAFNILQQGSVEQRKAIKEKTIGRDNALFTKYMQDQLNISTDRTLTEDQREEAEMNYNRCYKIAEEVHINT